MSDLASQETAPEAAPETAPAPETTEAPTHFDYTHKGEDGAESIYSMPVALKEALDPNDRMRHADYTKKTKALSDERTAFETRVSNWDKAQKLQQASQAKVVEYKVIEAELKRYENVNWAAYGQQDQNAAMQLQQHLHQQRQKMEHLRGEIGQIQGALDKQHQEESEAAASKFKTDLGLHLPDWSDAKKAEMIAYLDAIGYGEEQFNDIQDVRMIQLINDAMFGRTARAAKSNGSGQAVASRSCSLSQVTDPKKIVIEPVSHPTGGGGAATEGGKVSDKNTPEQNRRIWANEMRKRATKAVILLCVDAEAPPNGPSASVGQKRRNHD